MRQQPDDDRAYARGVTRTPEALDRTFAVVVEGYSYLESPRWHGGRLWFSDFYYPPGGLDR